MWHAGEAQLLAPACNSLRYSVRKFPPISGPPCRGLCSTPQARFGHQNRDIPAKSNSIRLKARTISTPLRSVRGRPVGCLYAVNASSATIQASLLSCEVQKASTPAELRAAAFLRAVSFYTYPPGRSEYAAKVRHTSRVRAHLKLQQMVLYLYSAGSGFSL